MNYRIVLMPLLIATTTFTMENQVPLATFAKNYKHYLTTDQFDNQLTGRKEIARLFAKSKIEEIKQSYRLPQLFAYSGLAIAGVSLSLYGLYHLSQNISHGFAFYCHKADPSVEFLKVLGIAYHSSLGLLRAVETIAGAIGCGIGLYKIPSFLSKTFETRKTKELEHYKNFKFAVKTSSVK